MLIGIKDTDDNLVASTLICLSELVPILGADTVIGGKRSKLFTDGRPNSKISVEKVQDNIFPSTKSLRDLPCSEEIYNDDIVSPAYEKAMSLNERPSPVGGESIDNEHIMSNEKLSKAGSEEDWSDWDNTNRQLTIVDSVEILKEDIFDHHPLLNPIETVDSANVSHIKTESKDESITRTKLLHKAAIEAKRNIVDISELDIKNQKFEHSKKNNDDFDFFADMMPVIEKPAIINVNQAEELQSFSSKLSFVPAEEGDENEGWGDNWNE